MGVHIRDLWNYQALFLLIAAFTLVAIVLLVGMRYRPTPASGIQRPKQGSPIRLANLIAVECIVYALIGGMFSLGNGVVNAFLLLMGEERGISRVALFFSINAAALFCIRLFVGRMADEKGLSLVNNISLALTVGSMLLLSGARGLPIILIAAVLKAIGQRSGQLSLQSACIKKGHPSRIGIATSTFYIGADIGQSVGPMLGGQISARMGYGPLFAVVGGIIAASMVLFNIAQQRQTKSIDLGK